MLYKCTVLIGIAFAILLCGSVSNAVVYINAVIKAMLDANNV